MNMASSSSSSMLAVAVLAALLVGAWCDCEAPAPFKVTVLEGSAGKKLVVRMHNLNGLVVNATVFDPNNGRIVAKEPEGSGTKHDVFTFESKKEPLWGPYTFDVSVKYISVVPMEYSVGATYTAQFN